MVVIPIIIKLEILSFENLEFYFKDFGFYPEIMMMVLMMVLIITATIRIERRDCKPKQPFKK